MSSIHCNFFGFVGTIHDLLGQVLDKYLMWVWFLHQSISAT